MPPRHRRSDNIKPGEGEQLYRRLFEQATQGIGLADAETGIILDCNQAFCQLTGYCREELIGHPQAMLHPPEEVTTNVSHTFNQHRAREQNQILEASLVTKSGERRQVEIKAGLVDWNGRRVVQAFFQDVTEALIRQRERESTLELMRLLNSDSDVHELVRLLTGSLQSWSGCEAVGVRLREGEDFPYFETRGFPPEFVRVENRLCQRDPDGQLLRDSQGNPLLECMCGNILCGRIDPGLPFFTSHGSFWTNSTSELLATTTERERQSRTRNRCNGEGYESVALVPLRSAGRIIGLLQLNDHARGRFTPGILDFLERTSDQIAIALDQRLALSKLRTSEDRFHTFFDLAPEYCYMVSSEGMILDVNRSAIEVLGYERGELVGKLLTETISAPSSHGRARVLLERWRQQGFLLDEELTVLTRSGEERTVLLSVQPVYDDSGKLMHSISMQRDITGHKQAEQQLRRNRDELARAQAIANVGSYTVDIEKEESHWTDELFRIIGCEGQEASRKMFNSLVHPEDRDRRQEAVRRAWQHGIVFELEYRIVRPDGAERWLVERLAEIERDAAGFPIRGFGTIQDITKRKRIEERLELMAGLLDLSPVSVLVFDFEEHFLYANQRTLDYGGYSREELERFKLEEFFPLEHRPLVREKLKLLAEKGELSLELTGLRKDGTVFPLMVSARLARWEGRPVILTIAIDITERKRAEEALRESERRYREIFESTRDGIFLIEVRPGPGFVFREFNPAEEKLVELATAEVAGRTVEELFDRELAEQLTANYRQCVERREVLRYEEELQFSSGPKNFFTTLLPLSDETGKVCRIVGIAHDITEQKKLERERIELEHQLLQSQKIESIGLLAGGVAHDLNNLLTPILMHAEMLKYMEKLDAASLDSVQEIINASQRARDLVRQLMAFGRKQALKLKALDLNRVLREFTPLLRRTLREDIQLRLELAPGLPMVTADRSQLEQVLMNLAVNAQDALPEGGGLSVLTAAVDAGESGQIPVTGLQPGHYVLLSFSDDGIGMEPQIMDRVFEPFFTTKEFSKGTGLGLSTVYGIVRQHGGEIMVESKPGRGTTFRIYLPARKAETREELPAEDLTEVKAVVGGKETILLTEDDPAVRAVTGFMLETLGYRVISAESPSDCLEKVPRLPGAIALLLTDVVMPEMNGKELYERMRQWLPQLRVVYMSGYPQEVIAHRGVLEEGVAYLQKPFGRKDLAQAIRRSLDR